MNMHALSCAELVLRSSENFSKYSSYRRACIFQLSSVGQQGSLSDAQFADFSGTFHDYIKSSLLMFFELRKTRL